MLQEAETNQRRSEPPVSRHRPLSHKSQDISHVLANIFKETYTKDIIGKDTLSNLVKTKTGGSSYHEKYLQELQQAHAEYEHSVQEADMLESHIIQARARAADTETRLYQQMREDLDHVCDDQGLLTVKSAFPCCVDQDLLVRKDLIAPQDYLTSQRSAVRAPVAVKVNPAKPTIASKMRASHEPQGGGCGAASTAGKTVFRMEDLDHSLTFDPSSDGVKEKKTPEEGKSPMKLRPRWRDEPSAEDRAEGRSKLRQFKNRHSFLLNPRFLPPNAQRGAASLIQPPSAARAKQGKTGADGRSPADDPVPIFQARPPVVVFTDYSVGNVYETTLELKNVTSSSRHVRVIPPATPFFSLGLGRFPGEGGVVAPGMSCKYTLRFAPDSLSDYRDLLVVETLTEQLLAVPVQAARPPPVLTLPRVLDCGYCLIGGVKFVEFLCQNVGLSAGTFCFIPHSQWPASNLRSVSRTYFSEQPPFAVSPSFFKLRPGEAVVVEVVFFPSAAEKSRQVFTVVCDNCQVKDFSIQGEGQLIAVELVSVSGQRRLPAPGEIRDLTADHVVRFQPSNPHCVQQKTLVIRNNAHLELPFFWQLRKPNLHPLPPGETPESSHVQFHPDTEDVFHVSPSAGTLAPCQDREFVFTFCPKDLKEYHSVCHLVLRDVPQLPPEPSESSVLQPVQTGSKLRNVVAMEIEVTGSAGPLQVLLEPYAVVIPGELFVHAATRRRFKMWNHSRSSIAFRWEKLSSSSHVMEVEPSAGKIEENECFDFDLIVTGEKPGRVVSGVVCHIEHRQEPVTLAVEASFKGPSVTVSVPAVDFGLVRLGGQSQTRLQLSNPTQLEALWELKERSHADSPIRLEPSRGVLPPLASCGVDVVFTPRCCMTLETELQLSVENGNGCHLSVRAVVQAPQVCLLSSRLVLPELHCGVPAEGVVTLFNQTLLPSRFSWKTQLRGRQAAVCSASFEPRSAALGPNASMQVKVHFTSHTDQELSDVAAVCQVQGMNSPLLVDIVAPKPKTLSVSYSLPASGSPQDGRSPSPLLLDFGDVILKEAVTKQFLMTNQTAIAAPFTISAQFFSAEVCRSERRLHYVRKPLHSAQAKKVEEKANEEFVSRLLAHGKGAAFLALPDSGTLKPFETLTVDVTAHADMWGEYTDLLVCRVGALDAVLLPVQMTVRGCPLYFQMTGRQTDQQRRGPVIHFGAHISGGDTVSRSLRINNPTMFDVRLDWETYNQDPDDGRLVDVVVAFGDAFPLKDADGNELPRGAPIPSGGNTQSGWKKIRQPESEETSSALQSSTDAEEEEFIPEEDEEACLHPPAAEGKLLSVHIRPHMGVLSDYPYCITPQQIVIPARSSGVVHVSFTPLTLSAPARQSTCDGFALGFMSLDHQMAACIPGKVKRSQGLDLEPVRMDLLAAVKPAALSVQMEEDDGVLEFHATAGDLLRPGSDKEIAVREFHTTRSFRLQNSSEMPLHFRLGTRAPFSVLQLPPRVRTSASSNPPTGDGQSLVLQPQHSMRVSVAFHCSPPLLDHEDQTEEETPPGVSLTHSATGHRKLQFEQNLLIRFSNNTLQAVPLRALLDLPTLRSSCDVIDFDFCCVGRTRRREVNLSCCGAQTFWKSELQGEDPPVFNVSPDFGLLRSEGRDVSQRLQISFSPSEDREFRAALVLRSPLLKKLLTLQLRGTGSHDEAYAAESTSS